KFRRANIILALGIVAPTIRANDRTRLGGVPRELLIARRREVISRAVKNPLRDDARSRRDSQPIELPIGIGFSRGAISGNDAGNVGPVAVLVRGIRQPSISKKRRRPPEQI